MQATQDDGEKGGSGHRSQPGRKPHAGAGVSGNGLSPSHNGRTQAGVLDEPLPAAKSTLRPLNATQAAGLARQLNPAGEPDFSQPEVPQLIHVRFLRPNASNPRQFAESDKLRELKESIVHDGLREPLKVVQRLDGTLTLIGGHRRLAVLLHDETGQPLSSEALGFDLVPCLIVADRPLKESEILSLLIRDNDNREGLTGVELARAIRTWMEQYEKDNPGEKATQALASKEFSLPQPEVSKLLALLNLPKEVQDIVAKGQLAETTARLLLQVSEPPRRIAELADEIARRNFTAAEARGFLGLDDGVAPAPAVSGPSRAGRSGGARPTTLHTVTHNPGRTVKEYAVGSSPVVRFRIEASERLSEEDILRAVKQLAQELTGGIHRARQERSAQQVASRGEPADVALSSLWTRPSKACPAVDFSQAFRTLLSLESGTPAVTKSVAAALTMPLSAHHFKLLHLPGSDNTHPNTVQWLRPGVLDNSNPNMLEVAAYLLWCAQQVGTRGKISAEDVHRAPLDVADLTKQSYDRRQIAEEIQERLGALQGAVAERLVSVVDRTTEVKAMRDSLPPLTGSEPSYTLGEWKVKGLQVPSNLDFLLREWRKEQARVQPRGTELAARELFDYYLYCLEELAYLTVGKEAARMGDKQLKQSRIAKANPSLALKAVEQEVRGNLEVIIEELKSGR